jgi:hypothetical protein
MTLIARLAPLLLFPLLAGCVPIAAGLAPDDGPNCPAARLQGLVGQPAVFAQTVVNPSGSARIIRPGQAVTMDYSPSRLNIEIDANERIVSVRCG